jgi:hypothetical protein
MTREQGAVLVFMSGWEDMSLFARPAAARPERRPSDRRCRRVR